MMKIKLLFQGPTPKAFGTVRRQALSHAAVRIVALASLPMIIGWKPMPHQARSDRAGASRFCQSHD
jgi:hypothetical protein